MIVLSLSVLGTACVTRKASQARLEDRKMVEEELGSETSLKSDRDYLEHLRTEIPEEKKKSNDELALFLNMMNQGNQPPQAIRDKFQYMIQKKRQSFREKVQKLRDDFRSEESKRRDQFLDEHKRKRDRFVSSQRDSKETRAFFATQEKERLAFFADERSRRQNFESEINSHSKDFDSYMRERQKEFDEQYRIYSKKFSERPKEKKAVTGDEFKRLDEAPATSLGTEN